MISKKLHRSISDKGDNGHLHEMLRLKHACITAFCVLTDEEIPEHRRIELAIEHLQIVQ